MTARGPGPDSAPAEDRGGDPPCWSHLFDEPPADDPTPDDSTPDDSTPKGPVAEGRGPG